MGKKARQLRYRIGIDVGLYSVGLSAIEIDDSSDNPYDALPIRLLSTMSYLHDAGVDPQHAKQADSRKASSGVARRTRRLRRREHNRLKELDRWLEQHNYPLAQAKLIAEGKLGLEKTELSYPAWNARIHAVENHIENDYERLLTVTVAVRHIARHRGWRNPYSNIASVQEASAIGSPFYEEFFKKVQLWLYTNQKHQLISPDVKIVHDDKEQLIVEVSQDFLRGKTRPTVAQLIKPFLDPQNGPRFRSVYKDENMQKSNLVQIGKLHQSDYCYELLRIFNMQNIPENEQTELLEIIFAQINPRDVGAAAKLVGTDDLPGQGNLPRASRASLAFQRFRILDTITNLRIKTEEKTLRTLTSEEIQSLFDFLTTEATEETTWHDIAEHLHVSKNNLAGIGGETENGEPISTKHPPVLDSDLTIKKAIKNAKKELQKLDSWWKNASLLEKDFFIESLDNAGMAQRKLSNAEQQALYSVNAFLQSLTDDALLKIENISLAAGRSAYSIDSLNRLSSRMLNEGIDLFTARKLEFGVDDTWKPSSNALGTPTGNPAVDRTISIVSRWIKACHKRWGAPETINLEHVRDGFKTPKTMRKEQTEINKRAQANDEIRKQIIKALNEQDGSGIRGTEAIRRADIRRWQAVQRQSCKCIYCGKEISYATAQMDHIVPRKGVGGASNDLPNLVAACASCNQSKNNTLFYTWKQTDKERKEVLNRVDGWLQDGYFSSQKQFKNYLKDVKARLMQKEEDPPIDTRSIESVAWMARELRSQIEGFFDYQGVTTWSTQSNSDYSLSRVNVYRGSLTAEARMASGLENKLPWIGGYQKKTRIDRRHHAVDASVITMMRPGVAKVLAERESLRREQIENNLTLEDQFKKYGKRFWKAFEGAEEQELYSFWKNAQMQKLTELLSNAMTQDKIVISTPKRLRIQDGRAHNDTIRPLIKRKVGDALTPTNIDKAATPALWLALTNHPDFDPIDGLPEDSNRKIRIHDQWLDSFSTIGFMANSEEDFNKTKDAVCISVRNGFAEIGNTIHHARFFRIPKINKKGVQTGWKYAYMRVFKTDLLKHQHEDLFSVDIPACSISRRSATPALRKALDEGIAEQIGWVVVGDEIEIDPKTSLFSQDGSNAINCFMKAFPETKRFKVAGFPTNEQIQLEPLLMSSESLPNLEELTPQIAAMLYGDENIEKNEAKKINTVLGAGGSFHPSVDKLLNSSPTIIRRNTLGEIRWSSNNHMPVSWKVPRD